MIHEDIVSKSYLEPLNDVTGTSTPATCLAEGGFVC
jgi:hypothetical protein